MSVRTIQGVRRPLVAAVLFASLAVRVSEARADNPIVQTNYTADPAPMVHDGRLYVYTSHDEDVTVNDFFTMNDWKVYSTGDMVNWTDHGTVASYRTFSWGTGDAWAPHAIARNDKFYLYVPLNNSTGARIGVAVSDSPFGPFTDPLGKALIARNEGNIDIDPTVFIDDDGQAYLYFGNPALWYVKLNADMISYSGSPTKVDVTPAGFGTRTAGNPDGTRPTAYEEGPWFYKRDSFYYLVYPADGTPEKISYSMSTGPVGPWTFAGDIMAKQTGAGSSFTNHPGVIDFAGKSYFFYHNGGLPGGGGYKRSVCVEEFTYGPDGKIPTIQMSKNGPAPVATLDPFKQVEAETIAFSSGLKTEACTDTGGGLNVSSIDNNDYIKVRNVDFGDGVVSFEARVSNSTANAKIELRLDAESGTPLATCDVSGASSWTTKTCTVTGATGKHDLFLKFTGGTGNLFKFNWWKFTSSTPPDPNGGAGSGGASGAAGLGGQSGGGVAGVAGGPGSVTGGTSGASGGSTNNTSGMGGLGTIAPPIGGTAGAAAGGAAGAQVGSGGLATGGAGRASAGTGGSAPASAGAATAAGAGPGPGAPVDEDSSDSGGCAYHGRSAARHAPPLALLLLGLGLRRRARRARAGGGASESRDTRSASK